MNPYDPIETYTCAILLVAHHKDASHLRIVPKDGKADVSLFIGGRWWPEDCDAEIEPVINVLCKQIGLPPPLKNGRVHTGRMALQRDDNSVLCYLAAISHTDAGLSALVELVDEPTFKKRSEPVAP